MLSTAQRNEKIINTKCLENGLDKFDFGDKRLDKRGKLIIDRMEKKVGVSTPNIFTNNAELQGAYRFVNNDLVTPEKILSPHRTTTISRIRNEELVAIIQDSSDLSFDHMTDLKGLGKLHSGIKKGLRIHPQLAISEQGTPLGTIHSLSYTRDDEAPPPQKNRRQLPIEEKDV
ncbi:MAG: hypothetical protein ACI9YB_000905 [Halioglobus sp.]|jgi:hypothetical protein